MLEQLTNIVYFEPRVLLRPRVLYSTPQSTNKNGPEGAIFIGGGAGGNRTRVRKSSKDSSTYLVGLFKFNRVA